LGRPVLLGARAPKDGIANILDDRSDDMCRHMEESLEMLL
jgi:hypothetical protein